MAKNLQSVLNSVVSDLLQEQNADYGKVAAAGDSEYMQNLAQTNPSLYVQKKLSGLEVQDAMDAADRAEAQKFIAGHDFSQGVVPHHPADVARSAAQAQKVIDAAVTPQERLNNAYWDVRDAVGGAYDKTADFVSAHPYAAGLGGLGAAALAAGAGAMYLRKKKRAADAAAGR